MLIQSNINSETALYLMQVGVLFADSINSPSNIAVVDSSGFMISHVRMDKAQLPSIEHAINKAWTSALFKKPTHHLKSDSEPGGQLYGLNNTCSGRVIVFSGGVPLWHKEQLVGAVGVSGGTAEQDLSIAKEIAERFQEKYA